MESEAVSDLYKWSIANCAICYIPFIGDGDSSSYSAVKGSTLWSLSVCKEIRVCQSCNKENGNKASTPCTKVQK